MCSSDLRGVSQTVFWHRELPPLDGEVVAEHFLEATSDHVSGGISYRDELWSREILSVEKVKGLDIIMQDAIEGKFIAKPLTQAEVEEMIAPWARP